VLLKILIKILYKGFEGMSKNEINIINNILNDIEEHQKSLYPHTYSKNKTCPCVELIKDEFREIHRSYKLHRKWSSYCFTDYQCKSILRLCDALNIPYSYKYVYDKDNPDIIDYIDILNK
jgi:hypothetical protein